MPSTTTFRRGQVVVIDVPFSNHSGVKPRPALVVSAEAFHRDLADISKLLAVDKRIVRRILGEGSRRDVARVEAVLMQALGFPGR